MHFPELKLRRGWVRGLTWTMLLTQRLWISSSTHTLRYAPGTSTCGARSQITVKVRPEAWWTGPGDAGARSQRELHAEQAADTILAPQHIQSSVRLNCVT